MIVTCPRCLTKYNLLEEKLVPGAELNLHCSRCSWEFLFSPQDSDGDQKSVKAPSPPEMGELEAIPAEVIDPVGLEDKGSTDVVVTNEVEGEAESVNTSPPVVEEVVAEVAENASDEAIFELADDFDSEEDFLLDELPDPQKEVPELIEKSKNEDDDQELEELVLDIDDLNLDDIEFDSFDGDLDTVEGLDEMQKESPKERPTQIDDDGDLDDLLDQVEGLSSEATASTIVEGHAEEPAKSAEVDSFVEGSVSSATRVKSAKVTGKRRSFILVLSCFVVLSLALWIGYGLWQRFSVDMVKHLKLVEVENRRLRLPSERIVIVLRGKVINSSSKLVTDLKIKGVLLDEAGQAVAEVVTAGGVSFSEEELDRLDGSKLAMLENNTVTLPPNGGELPFMIAFYDYPEMARECFVELSSFKVKKGPRP